MFAPVITIDGSVAYVNPQQIDYIVDNKEPLSVEAWGAAPDGNPWPTCVMYFAPEHFLTVRGTTAMLLGSWFGRPANDPQPRIVVAPPGSRVR